MVVGDDDPVAEEIDTQAAPAKPVSLPRVAALLSALVGAFSLLWTRGALVVDGPGNSFFVRLARDYLLDSGRIPYWLPDIWSGGPVWAVAPSLPVALLVPISLVAGPDGAIKFAVLALQVAGGLGVYVLARSLWGTRIAPIVSAIVYSLHPIIVSHGALLGGQAILGVTAAMPWLAWSLRRGLRGDGSRFLVASGFLAAFAVLHQAEYALALVPLCVGVLIVEISAARFLAGRGGRGGQSKAQAIRPVLARMGGVIGLALALVSYWLLPFLTLGKSFILSPPELVEGELNSGLANTVGREIGVFFNRPSPIAGVVSFNRGGLVAASFYVGWTCLALTALTVVLLARRKGHAHLTAVLVGSAFVLWLSTGPVALASSGPALRNQLIPLAIAGALAGLLIGGLVRRIENRKGRAVCLGASVLLIATMPYLTPFLTLQKVVPLLDQFRFPRFYMLAVLGLAFGTGFPLVLLEQKVQSEGRREAKPSRMVSTAMVPRAMVPTAAAIAVVVLFWADIFPVSSQYRVRPPTNSRLAYEDAAVALAATKETGRVAPSSGDPRSVGSVLRAGAVESTGWPHPLAGRQLWRLTNETFAGPQGYREAALGLSSTSYVSAERVAGAGGKAERVTDVVLLRNPRLLPLVRSYEQAVLMDDADLAPLVATSLAYRNVGVVTVRGGTPDLGGMPSVRIRTNPCTGSPTGTEQAPPIIGGEVALACAVDGWIGRLLAGTEVIDIGEQGVGASFVSRTNGLRGVAVWLLGGTGQDEMALYEMDGQGHALGREVARSQAVGLDEYGLTTYSFDPIPESAGHRYGFLITCNGCLPDDRPRVVTGVAEGRTGDVLSGNRRLTDRVASFAPLHDRLPAATVPAEKLSAQRVAPGNWKVVADGPNPSLLVLAETWFPGWRARVDGKEAAVFQADGAFLGVAIPPGHHEVTLTFRRPAAAVVGRLITFGTLAGLGVAWWRRRRRRGHRTVARRLITPQG